MLKKISGRHTAKKHQQLTTTSTSTNLQGRLVRLIRLVLALPFVILWRIVNFAVNKYYIKISKITRTVLTTGIFLLIISVLPVNQLALNGRVKIGFIGLLFTGFSSAIIYFRKQYDQLQNKNDK